MTPAPIVPTRSLAPRIVAPLLGLVAAGLSFSCGSPSKGHDATPRATAPRSVEAPAVDVFSSEDPLALILEAAFDAPFEAARAGLPDGIFPQPREKEPFEGTLAGTKVELKVRGNSSLAECSFPKLSVKAKAPVTVSGVTLPRKWKLGTHCADLDDTTNGTIGRLLNEKSPGREALAYDLAVALGIEGLKSRVLKATYVMLREGEASERITRTALLLEHVDEMAKRLGGKAIDDPETLDTVAWDKVEASTLLRIRFFQALIGNWDWRMAPPEAGESRPGLWNTELIERADGSLLPVPADFDLASIVTGDPSRVIGRDKPLNAENARLSVGTLLGENLAKFPAADVAAMKAELRAKKEALLSVVSRAAVDDRGREIARLHVEAFFNALAE